MRQRREDKGRLKQRGCKAGDMEESLNEGKSKYDFAKTKSCKVVNLSSQHSLSEARLFEIRYKSCVNLNNKTFVMERSE